MSDETEIEENYQSWMIAGHIYFNINYELEGSNTTKAAIAHHSEIEAPSQSEAINTFRSQIEKKAKDLIEGWQDVSPGDWGIHDASWAIKQNLEEYNYHLSPNAKNISLELLEDSDAIEILYVEPAN